MTTEHAMSKSSDPAARELERCAGCGLLVAGGGAGCQSLMDQVLARQFGDAAWFGCHRLFVDIYALQHPDRYCVSFKSLAAHLAHACWTLERGGTAAVACEAIRRWVEQNPDLEKPVLPKDRGAVTVADVARAATAGEHRAEVVRWASATWEAYGPLHGVAREWVDRALASPRGAHHGRKRAVVDREGRPPR